MSIEREIHIPQGPIIKPHMEQTNAQLTPEYLDSIINNPNEHPHIKKQAEQMKNNLFKLEKEEKQIKKIKKQSQSKPKSKELNEEDFISEVKKENHKTDIVEENSISESDFTIKIEDQPKQVSQVPKLQIQQAASQNFDSFLSEFKNNLFNDEFALLSSPEVKLQLRSMTVGEYKFLSKQNEIYRRSLENVDENNLDISREVDIRESILTNAIDNVLQRCVTNNIRIYDLTLFDWIYISLALRAISRGTESNLRVRCSDKKCNGEIKIGVSELLEKLDENKESFTKNPIAIIPIKEDISVYLSLPKRGDLVEAQKIFLGDNESSLSFVNTSMYIRAYIKNNTAYLLEPQQRYSLFNVLDYEEIKKIQNVVNENISSFYRCFSELKCSNCKKTVEVDISDFILFFYDF